MCDHHQFLVPHPCFGSRCPLAYSKHCKRQEPPLTFLTTPVQIFISMSLLWHQFRQQENIGKILVCILINPVFVSFSIVSFKRFQQPAHRFFLTISLTRILLLNFKTILSHCAYLFGVSWTLYV